MGLEKFDPNSEPDILNPNWPEGNDDMKYGDNHIRLVKTTLKNFFTKFTDYKTEIGNLFDGTKAKEAVEADNAKRFNNKDPDKYALVDGDYAGLRARATTKDDVGLNRVNNWYPSAGPTDASADRYARAVDVKAAYDQANYAVSKVTETTTFNGIGSYMLAVIVEPQNIKVEPGFTIAGGYLRPVGLQGRSFALQRYSPRGSTLPGTWRVMGFAQKIYTETYVSLFVRIA